MVARSYAVCLVASGRLVGYCCRQVRREIGSTVIHKIQVHMLINLVQSRPVFLVIVPADFLSPFGCQRRNCAIPLEFGIQVHFILIASKSAGKKYHT